MAKIGLRPRRQLPSEQLTTWSGRCRAEWCSTSIPVMLLIWFDQTGISVNYQKRQLSRTDGGLVVIKLRGAGRCPEGGFLRLLSGRIKPRKPIDTPNRGSHRPMAL